MRTAILLATLLLTTVHGVVRDESGAALPGVTIYEKGANDTVVTDANGRFALDVAQLPATIVAFLGGFDAVTVDARTAEVEMTLKLAAMSDSVTVTAKTPRSANTSSYDVKPLEVLRTAGAQADLFKALQTLPGVAKVDDGAGLFVRGGDVSEVRVMLDGATIDHPFRYESPAGGQFGSVPPLLLEGIAFSTGGFSARYGNALSAIVDLRGLGTPSSAGMSATGGLAGLSGHGAIPIGDDAGFRASGNFSSTRLLFALNGAPRAFDQMPTSWDLNASGHLESPSLGTLKVFAMTQRDSVGVDFQREGFDGFLHSRSSQSIGIVNWKKMAGEWQLAAAAGADTYSRGTDVGVIALDTTDHQLDARFDASRSFGTLVLRTGFDADHGQTITNGVKSLRGHDYGGASGSVRFDVDESDTHAGAYAELEKTVGRLTPTAGVRVDGDRFLGTLAVDPRLNLTVAMTPNQKLRLAWGLFHQAPSAQYFDRVAGAKSLQPMEAEHWIAGYEYGTADGPLFARVEAYSKTYRSLPLDNNDGFTSDGYGYARGIDFFASKKWSRGDVRLSYGILDARRRWTPADQQQRFILPSGMWHPDFDVPRTLAIVGNVQLTPSLGAGMTFTAASGRPNTPIVGATQGTFGLAPIYGAINSERLPDYQRADVNVTYHPKSAGRMALLYFFAVNNVFAHRNVSDYAYSANYSTRAPVASLAPRSAFVGFTIIR
jgi:hypothetical protein